MQHTSIRGLRSCLAGKSDSKGGRAGVLEVPESSKTVCRETELVLGCEARSGARRKKNRKIKRHLVPIESLVHLQTQLL